MAIITKADGSTENISFGVRVDERHKIYAMGHFLWEYRHNPKAVQVFGYMEGGEVLRIALEEGGSLIHFGKGVSNRKYLLISSYRNGEPTAYFYEKGTPEFPWPKPESNHAKIIMGHYSPEIIDIIDETLSGQGHKRVKRLWDFALEEEVKTTFRRRVEKSRD